MNIRPRLVKTIAIPIQDVDKKQGIITGLFAHFDSLDKHGDIIQKGAFRKTILENGPNGTNEIAHLLDHKSDKAVGVITKLEESSDYKGLYYESKIGTHQQGKDFAEMVDSGIIKFHSIGYSVINETFDKSAKANILKEIKLYEGSSLQFIAANHNTPVLGMKSFEDIMEYFAVVEKFVKTSTASDETLQELELKLQSLSAFIKAGKSTFEQKADHTQLIIDLINKRQNGI
jgi:HK97 family phage prohead protease